MLYRIATLAIVLELLAGGIGDLLQARWAAEVMVHLGYPLYVMSILGAWKVLGAIAIAQPQNGLLAEWAYAGTFFELTGALASHVLARDAIGSYIAPVVFAVLTLISWHLRKSRWCRPPKLSAS